MRKFWAKVSATAMAALALGVGAIAQSAGKPVKLEVDLREAPRRI